MFSLLYGYSLSLFLFLSFLRESELIRIEFSVYDRPYMHMNMNICILYNKYSCLETTKHLNAHEETFIDTKRTIEICIFRGTATAIAYK